MPVSLMPESQDDPLGLNGLLGTIDQIFGKQDDSSSTTTTTLDGPAGKLLRSLTDILIPEIQRDYYSPAQAKSDSAALIKQAMDEFTKNGLPQIYQSQGQSGGYNSTTAQLMANDAETSAAVKGASLAAANIDKYAVHRQAQLDTLTKFVTTIASILKTTKTDTTKLTGQSPDVAKKLAALAAAMKKASSRDMKGGVPKSKNNTAPKPTPAPGTGAPNADTVDDGREDNFDNNPNDQLDAAINYAEQVAGNPTDLYVGDPQYAGPDSPESIMSDIMSSVDSPGADMTSSGDFFSNVPDITMFDPFGSSFGNDSSGDSGGGGDLFSDGVSGPDSESGDSGDTTSFLTNGGNTGDLPVGDWWDSLFGDLADNSISGGNGDGSGFFGGFFDSLFGSDNMDEFDFSFDSGDDFSFDTGDFGDSSGDFGGYGGA